MVTRSAEWGNWGITFVSWEGPARPYLVNIHGIKYFPVGSQGPIDARPGDRALYLGMIAAWADSGTLPSGLDTRHASAHP